MESLPNIGDRIVAKRRITSKIYHNTIIGPVTDVSENACRVTTNAGTDIESNWQINYSDWKIENLEAWLAKGKAEGEKGGANA